MWWTHISKIYQVASPSLPSYRRWSSAGERRRRWKKTNKSEQLSAAVALNSSKRKLFLQQKQKNKQIPTSGRLEDWALNKAILDLAINQIKLKSKQLKVSLDLLLYLILTVILFLLYWFLQLILRSSNHMQKFIFLHVFNSFLLYFKLIDFSLRQMIKRNFSSLPID